MKKTIVANLKYDLPAGLVVFLVALPLCLGVALASGAPLLSGIISGIIGGIVVGLLSGSNTSVSGPAAGLTAVVLAAITQLGNFELFLVAVILAGAIQIGMGLLKAGFVADYIPSNVIKGLLSAIGIILILKQLPHAVGFDITNEADFNFQQADGENTFSELLRIFDFIAPGAVIISVISLFILMMWDKISFRKLKIFPASLLVVIMGIGLNELFLSFFPALALQNSHLVNIPDAGAASLFSFAKIPDVRALFIPKVWTSAITIAIIASLETLLNVEAVDNIDPQKRQSPPNRELIAQGVGNMTAGLLGGIPVTSVIVRSSVNIYANARTKLSSVFHGILLFVSVLFLAKVLNLIPLSCLAAILLVTGYKLAKISIFKELYAKGWNQFIPFVATIIAIVFTDLLTGILIGLTVSIFYLMKSNFLNPFQQEKENLPVGEVLRLELSNQVSFLNKASIKNTLWNIPEKSKVIIDATHSDYIDHDVREVIDDFKNTVAPEKKIMLNVVGMKKEYQLSDHIQFLNVLDKETQQNIKPSDVIELLKKGNERFIKGKWSEKYLRYQVSATSLGQHPMAVVLSCIDSRTSAELIFDAGMGDIFSVRVAGNVANNDVLGSMEYACQVAGAKVVVVLGHTKCGAVKAACDNVQMGYITQLLQKISPSVELTLRKGKDVNDEDFPDAVAKTNVMFTMNSVLEQSAIIKELVEKGQIEIVGAMYNVKSGKVEFYNRPTE